MSKLVGLIGYAGSGKGAAAVELIGMGFVRVKFADPLKNMLRAIGLTDEHIEGSLKEVPCDLLCGQSPRHAMVTLGTDWGRRMIGDTLWIDIWKSRTSEILRSGARVVVDDVRFPNEVESVKRLGGELWRIERPGIGARIAHESESYVMELPADRVIRNDGNLDDLYWEIKNALEVGNE